MNRTLEDWREEIDTTDQQLLELLAKRLDTVKEIGKLKKEHGKDFHDKKRWQEVITSRLAEAIKLGLPKNSIQKVFEIIHEYSLEFEKKTSTDITSHSANFFTNKSIGIIGFGSFGKLFYSAILPKKNIKIFSPHASKKPENSSLPFVNSLEALVKNSDIIIPIVPINQFKSIIQQISFLVKNTSIVIDVCSVKEYPVAVMKKYLPKDVQWLATHPLFGPNTYEEQHKNLAEMKIVLCSDRYCEPGTYHGLKRYLQNLGLEVIETSAQDHDKMSAQSHFFVKSIHILAEKLHLHPTPIDTIPANEIFTAFKKMGVDHEIVLDMLRYNPYCKKIAESMRKELHDFVTSSLS